MNKNFTLTLIALLLSFSSFATIGSITGGYDVCIGKTTTFSDTTSGGTWSSSNTAVATIGYSTGVITGISTGTSMMTYTVGGSYVTHYIYVNPLPATIGGPSSVCVGSTVTLSDATGGGVWSSSSTSTATVTSIGVVTGVSSGVATITFLLTTGCYTTTTISVNATPTIYGPSTVCAGSTITLSDATPGGTWVSSNTALATVSSIGVVTGVSAGVINIYYIAGGCGAYHTVTVTGGSSITGPSTVCAGSTITLSDATSGGTWTTGNSSVATVSSIGVVTGVGSGTTNIYYLVGGCYAYHTVTVTGGASIYGPSTVCVGGTITLSDATIGGIWSSSNTTIATVVTTGVVTGISAGTINIYYSVGGCSAYHTVTVTTTSAISGGYDVCIGKTTTFSDATSGGTWSSGNTAVATIGYSTGVITGISTGTSMMTYTVGGCYVTHYIYVNPLPATIGGASGVCVGSSVTVSDATGGGVWSSSSTSTATVSSIGVVTGVSSGVATITYLLTTGCYATTTISVNATPTIYGPSTVCAGSTITLSDATPGGTWVSSDTAHATVSSIGVVTGVSAGVINIYYTAGGCGAYHTVTVTGGSSIAGPSTVCVGSTITLSDASLGGNYFSGSTSVATVGLTSGVVTGVSAGTATIYYSLGGCYANHTVTVVTGATITGPSTVCAGSTITLSDATPGGTWSSSNTAYATVTSIGVVTGVSAGVLNIYYSDGGCSAYHTVTVTGGASIYGPSTVCVGSTITLTDATGGGTWVSSDTSDATITSGGVVTGVSAGVVNIYYSVGGCYAYHTVTVGTLGAISGGYDVCIGKTATFSDATSGGTWTSSNTAVATIGLSTGVITGIATGTSMMTYSAGGCYVTHYIYVNPLPATIGGPSVVCAGSTITLSDATTGGTWTSSSTSVATVSSIGVVTGVSSGVATITYELTTGCYVVHSVSVTGGSSSISGPSTVCLYSTITLSDSTTGGTWLSSNTAVATVTSLGVVSGVSTGTCTIYYIVGGCYAYHTVTVISGSTITGPSTVCAGSTITLSDATPGGTWTSSNTADATVTSIGVVTGVSAGVVNIYYSDGGCSAYHTVTVTGGASIYGPSTVCVGSTITLTDATGGGTWVSSDTSDATVTSGGVVTGVSAGVINIYYSVGGCSAYHTVTVGTLGAISGGYDVCIGKTATFSDATSGGTWTSSNTAVATIGLSTGVITGIATGTSMMTYSAGGCYVTHYIYVNPLPATIGGPSVVCAGSTITLSDATTGGTWTSSSTSVATVSSIGVVTGVSSGVATITYELTTGCYVVHSVSVTGGSSSISGPSTVCLYSTITLSDSTTGGTWLSSNTAVATVTSLGVVSGVSTGTCTIYYIVGGCYAYHTVTVISGSTITGPSTVCAGSTITLSDATSGGTWSSSNTADATVTSIGVVTGVSAGVVNIYYSDGGCSAYHTVTVTGGASIYGPSTVCVGSTITLTDATGGGTWVSSDTSDATVTSGGVVTGISAGVINIYYSVGGCSAYHTVTVTGGATIYGPSTVCAGSTITLSDATGGGIWTSSNTSDATVVTTGVVTGVSAGVVNIYYSVGGCYAYHTVTVTGGASITGPSTVCAGSTITLSDATTGGTWTSSNTSIGTVSYVGVVTGVSAGTINIYYLVGGCYAYHTVTVTGGASISGPSTVCAGSTITLSDATGGGIWTSSNTSDATVVTTGVVTGVSAGVVNIYYSVGGCYAYHTVTVTGGASITGPSAVCVGSTITLSDATTGGTWTTGSSTVATVSSVGVVTGIASGVTNIYYLVDGCYAYHTVTVTGGASITGPSTVCAGLTITLSDATTGGSWSAGTTTVATVGITSGVVTGVSAGVTNIYYSVGGCSAYHTVTVNAAPTPISGPSTVYVGSTITLSDATSGGTWISGNTTLATVSSIGVVTGVSTGVLNIYYAIGGCGEYHIVTVATPPPGSIGGNVVSGDGKGTSAEIPVSGLLINLEDAANNILSTTNTDNTGAYSFTGLTDGDYIIYPQDINYTTTASAMVTINGSSESIANIDFKEYTGSKTIVPYTIVTGTNAIAAGSEINVYPNPTNGVLNIKWENQSTGNADIVLTDVVGREVLTSILNINAASGQTQINLKDLKNGIYLITIKSDNIYYSGKLVIQQ